MRRYPADNRAAHLAALAHSLWAAASLRLAQGADLAAGLALVDEAVRLYEGLAEADPQAFADSLRSAGTTRDGISAALGRVEGPRDPLSGQP
ncbi:hypothetical protein [Catellatospora sp. NPDC049133]|jgi:hypothetical protein|uniref:hypothetical protein n=1 Tax=Catellatospora sp. NPDC049133 TaxID=3155499 RepID=UPI00340AC08D